MGCSKYKVRVVTSALALRVMALTLLRQAGRPAHKNQKTHQSDSIWR